MNTLYFRALWRASSVGFGMRLVCGVSMVLGLSIPLEGQTTTDPFPGPVADTPYTIEVDIFHQLPNEPPTSNWQGFPNARPALMKLEPAYDGSGRLFTNSIRGRLYSISSDGSSSNVYLDLRSYFGNPPTGSPPGIFPIGMQQGLQSFAFHPDFNKPGEPGYGKFYTAQSTSQTSITPDFVTGVATTTHHEILMEWTAINPLAPTYDGAVGVEMMRIQETNIDHNTGTLSFNRNSQPGDDDYGMLYMSLGDGGGVGNPNGLSGTGLKPYGSILRIDPLGNNSANGKYGIPSDNPFVGADPKLDEIWLYGLRNPQRYSFDSGGDQNMFIADLGQGVVEEVNIGIKGANYGWSEREGSYDYVSDGVIGSTDLSNDGLYEYPIAEYDHMDYVDNTGYTGTNLTVSSSITISGGYVYRDHHFSPLYGKYVFADLVSGRLMVTDADNPGDGGNDEILELIVTDNGAPRTIFQEIKEINSGTNRADLRFGIGENGEIFLVNKQDNTIRVLRPVSLQLGDTDGDGDVDALDRLNIRDNFGGTGLGDTDGDRDVDIHDFINMKNNFGVGAGLASFVPEPTSVLLLGFGAIALSRRRR